MMILEYLFRSRTQPSKSSKQDIKTVSQQSTLIVDWFGTLRRIQLANNRDGYVLGLFLYLYLYPYLYLHLYL